MSELDQASCVPCRGGVPTLTAEQIEPLLGQVPSWRVLEQDGVRRLVREFDVPDFRRALELAVEIGGLAEREGHHPDLHVSWGRLGVELWTHKIRGLHMNDFILAAKIDALRQSRRSGSPGPTP